MGRPSLEVIEGGQDSPLSPHSITAEEAVLGAILLYPESIDNLDDLNSEDFFREKNRRIFAAMLSLQEDGEPIDLVTLVQRLGDREELDSVGGELALHALSEKATTSANIGVHAKIIKDKALLRHLIIMGLQATQAARDPGADPQDVRDKMDEGLLGLSDPRKRSVWIPEALQSFWSRLQGVLDGDTSLRGLPTGLNELDRYLLGLRPSELIVLAARPGMGKTSLMAKMALSLGRAGYPVKIFSLEMDADELAMRFCCAEARVNSQNVRRATILRGGDGEAALRLAKNELSSYPISIDDSPKLSVPELFSGARRFKRETGHKELGAVFVDYLQLMSLPKADRMDLRIGEATRAAKRLAKELNWPVVVLSQLNRGVENRPNKRPMLADLRESGSIESDSDAVVFVYRPEYYDDTDPSLAGLAELIVAKNRNGATGIANVRFIKGLTLFEDYDG